MDWARKERVGGTEKRFYLFGCIIYARHFFSSFTNRFILFISLIFDLSGYLFFEIRGENWIGLDWAREERIGGTEKRG